MKSFRERVREMQIKKAKENEENMNKAGKEIIEYCEKYKGTPTYTEVMLAIEFGSKLAQKYYF